jgi:uncharacterized membrane protein YhaH (DUF805 family)
MIPVAVGFIFSPTSFWLFFVFLSETVSAVLVIICLLAAAVVRRLHDAGHKGYWGLTPLPFLTMGLGGAAIAISAFGTGKGWNIERLFPVLFFSDMIYLLALAGVIMLLATPSQKGSNRFGTAAAA